MNVLRTLVIASATLFSHLIVSSNDFFRGVIDLRINKGAELKRPIFDGLPNEVALECFDCDEESRMPSRRDALNYRLVSQGWNKLFVFFVWHPRLKLQGNIFGYYGHTLEPHDNISVEPQFDNKYTQKIVDLMKQRKLVMGEFYILELEKEKSKIGLQTFLSEMIKSEAPSFRILSTDTEVPIMLANMIPENNYVKRIKLFSTFSAHAVESQKAIGELVRKCQNLRYLEMRGSFIGDVGAKAVAAALKDHQKLELIDWSVNNITDNGAIDFAKALETNKSIKQLFLDENRIGWEGAQAFALSLKKNYTLEKLDLASSTSTKAWSWSGNDAQSIRNVRSHVQEKGRKNRITML